MERKELITTRLKLKDVYPDIAGKIANDLEVDSGDVEFIRKGITPANLEIKDGERAIISYITTGAKDRDGEIVLPSGAMLSEYRKNPVVLFGHNYSSLPIGKNMWIKADEKGLIAKTQYAKHEEAEKVYQYRKDGFPLAESIGFIPVQAYHAQWKSGGPVWDEGTARILKDDFDLSANDIKGVWSVYTKWTMLEYSDVSVPANPEATQVAIGKGLIPGKAEEKNISKAIVKAISDLGATAEDAQEALKEFASTHEEKAVSVTVWDNAGNVAQVDAGNQGDGEEELGEKSAENILLDKNTDIKDFIKSAVTEVFEQKMGELYKRLDDEFINGTGGKEPKGFLDNPPIKAIDDDEIEFDLDENKDEEIELDFEPDDIKSIVIEAVSKGIKASNDKTISDIKQLTKDEIDRQKGRIISTEESGDKPET